MSVGTNQNNSATNDRWPITASWAWLVLQSADCLLSLLSKPQGISIPRQTQAVDTCTPWVPIFVLFFSKFSTIPVALAHFAKLETVLFLFLQIVINTGYTFSRIIVNSKMNIGSELYRDGHVLTKIFQKFEEIRFKREKRTSACWNRVYIAITVLF